MKNYFLYIITLAMVCSCTPKKAPLVYISYQGVTQKSTLTDAQKKEWWALDIEDDTIPGISLDEAYHKILNNKKHSKVIVAIIDTEVKKDHEALKDYIWVNQDEIPNNGIDDDANGYIDDIHGWNFIGNAKGENIFWANFEATRIVRLYDKQFQDIDTNSVDIKTNPNYLHYIRAKKYLNDKEVISKKITDAANDAIERYKETFKTLDPYIKKEEYTIPLLDSLEIAQPQLKKYIKTARIVIKYDLTIDKLKKEIAMFQSNIDYCLNFNYNERDITGDDPNDIHDRDYGNHLISKNTQWSHHATYVSKLVLGKENEITFMPLAITAYGDISKCGGDEHDKDIALAIRYAVDNGAKVINMSYGKEFSLHLDWVLEAIQYAEAHNVVVVSSSGNDSYNLDDLSIFDYPNDTNDDGLEVANNFINVSSSTYQLNENLRSSFSNYGKKEVDVFAPGTAIYTSTVFKEKYDFIDGTSMSAPIVSKVAALLFSYYPDLTAAQVKQIIMDSGVEYTIPVKVTSKDGEEQMIPFNELSKSGKIVNAYNAFLMADSISKTH